jgi:hypothetical protein
VLARCRLVGNVSFDENVLIGGIDARF